MTLTILTPQKEKKIIRAVTRIFTISVHNVPTYLSYETCNDKRGYGTKLPLSEIRCWEATATIPGGNIPL